MLSKNIRINWCFVIFINKRYHGNTHIFR
jgi:hypothetical protein